jgi:hypothetical protein
MLHLVDNAQLYSSMHCSAAAAGELCHACQEPRSSDTVSALNVLKYNSQIRSCSIVTLCAMSTEAHLSTKVGRSGPVPCVCWPEASTKTVMAWQLLLRGQTDFSATAGLYAAEQRGPK